MEVNHNNCIEFHYEFLFNAYLNYNIKSINIDDKSLDGLIQAWLKFRKYVSENHIKFDDKVKENITSKKYLEIDKNVDLKIAEDTVARIKEYTDEIYE